MTTTFLRRGIAAFGLVLAAAGAGAAPALEQIAEFRIPEANQGVGVDARHFYAVDNQVVAKYDKATGRLVKRWQGPKGGPILHLAARWCWTAGSTPRTRTIPTGR